jgi:His-Xaa-Ser repeat protein HxsA
VFADGFWWGLYPWDYPYYGYGDGYGSDPYDYGYNPYDYNNGYPYDYYNYYPYSDDDQSPYGSSGQSAANATVSAVQSQLAKLGYYNGAIDGILGDETEAALSRYQRDQNMSVTGTVNTATLQSLGVK